ncbi:MAG: MATE family efflux transporter [Firmicutes bacterium]|nr:MATE family efflux transporter [Bacillota bacterium]
MSKAMDMTKGNSFKQIIAFTIPLILGNVFQLTYNMVDSIVIGHFAGSEALASVGTSDPIMSLIILGVSGMCIGAGVLMSEFFGSGQIEKLREEMRTLTFMGIVFSAVVLIFGLFFSRQILIWIKAPASILSMATIYLRIIFMGMPFTVLYNIYSSGLRSIGNSTTPLKYLAISSVMNMVLDVLFIYFFHLNVLGAALATVLAEAFSAILCILYTEKNIEYLRFDWKNLSINKDLVNQTLSYGFFSALQQAAQPIGKLFIQGTVNSLGVASIAAFNAVGKIEDIGLVPGRTIANAATTFIAQNKGAQKKERMEKGYRQAMFMEVVTGIVISMSLFFFRNPLMSLFTKDQNIISEGAIYFSIMFVAYMISNFSNGQQGYFRGVGLMKTTFLGTLTQITIRACTTFILVPMIGIKGIGFACMIGWLCQISWQFPYRAYIYKKYYKA